MPFYKIPRRANALIHHPKRILLISVDLKRSLKSRTLDYLNIKIFPAIEVRRKKYGNLVFDF